MLDADASHPRAPSAATLTRAAEWYALLRDGSASEADRRAWSEWLHAHAEHRQAWQQVEAISRGFEPLQSPSLQTPAAEALRHARGSRPTRRQIVNGIALAGTAGLAGALGWASLGEGGVRTAWRGWTADCASATGELRDLTLADGTRLWLNTASAMDVALDGDERRLRLLGGEALIGDLAARDPRPLSLQCPQGTLRVAAGEGSRFNVRRDGPTTLLSVFDGAVEVVTADSGERRRVPAGTQTRFDARRIGASEPVDPARQSWTRGVLLAQDMPLGELVAELARYTRRHFSVAPEVASLRVLGGYPLRDADRALTMLQSVLPIQVRKPLPWWVSVEPA